MAGNTGFGTSFVDQMAVASWADGSWSEARLGPLAPLALHPRAHALPYGSSCFEALKAQRSLTGAVAVFRLDRHAARLRASAEALCLPVPPVGLVETMVTDLGPPRLGGDDLKAQVLAPALFVDPGGDDHGHVHHPATPRAPSRSKRRARRRCRARVARLQVLLQPWSQELDGTL